MLTKNQQAHAINWAMRYDIEGNSERFEKFAMFLNRRPNLKADILNFYKGLSPMTQRAYIALIFLGKEMKENKMQLFKKLYIRAVRLLLGLVSAAIVAKMLVEWIIGA